MQYLNAHWPEIIALLGSGFVINTVSSLVVGKVNRTGKVWQVIRVVHGILDRIDPKEPSP